MNGYGLDWGLRAWAPMICLMVSACGDTSLGPVDGTPADTETEDSTSTPPSGDDDRTATPEPTEDDATPTPEHASSPTPVVETPTPTPVPLPEGDAFHITALRLATDLEGADLDADGSPDSRFGATLASLYDVLYPMAEANIDASSFSADQKARTLLEVQEFLEAFVTADGWNASLLPMLEDDDSALLLGFEWSEPLLGVCSWYSAHLAPKGWVIDLELGALPGGIDAEGDGWFGPAPLWVPLELETTLTAGFSIGYATTLALDPGHARVEGYATAGLEAVVATGALSADQLTVFAGDMVDGLNSIIAGTNADLSAEQKAQAEEAVASSVDLDLDGDGELEAYSIGFVMDAEGVSVDP